MTALDLAREEREDLADFLAGLTPEQWAHPSLCAEWSVRDVAAHVVSFEEMTARDLTARFVRARLQMDRINGLGVSDLADSSTEQLVALLRDNVEPHGMGAGFGGRIALTDNMIHQQDIRRPLGLERTIPAERLSAALDFVRYSPTIRGALRARGVRLIATDSDWSYGKGPEVRGPGEALLVVMAGRPAALSDLAGPGVATLAARLG
ncbi:maleylpyruvate isomerase family mycothiol-dependent enzyme [Mycolicibacterium sp. P9-64]|uniref:maleylpyruvate isomerase family mycothiol-dependent enzyme n=1 Tax=Mycolicibacterium sp. P9-64 TaxID=2024612 RepID=UPI0011EF69F7|nr:maleylpyruvate isomerase family mycothiol-dependent enzyme [Mycolicibacterium sp. P9-64]KAA0083435.1 maleylpyruvate isomerase family mycothiol-dependent enzyme [Mycolicibacterium sp. P9-64]